MANGRAPAPLSITFKRGAPDHILLGTTFGALLSRDGGQTWRWLCEAPVEMVDADPEWFWLEDDSLLAVTFGAPFRRSEDGGCTWTSPEVDGGFLVDLAVHPTEPNVLLSVVRKESGPATSSRVLRSTDGGRTLGEPILELLGPRITGVRYAPSDPQHIYVAARSPTARISSLYHSSDGGQTFTEHVFRTGAGFEFELAGVHPREASRVFATTYNDNALFKSDDAGQTFTKVLSTGAFLWSFFADARDGSIWVSDNITGLYRSEDSGVNFSKLGEAPSATCIGGDGQVLYICANAARDGFAIGKRAGDSSFVPFLRWFDAIQGPLECPVGTVPREDPTCAPAWPNLASLVGGTAGGSAGASGSSGRGEAPARSADPSNCGCRASSETKSWLFWPIACLATLGLLRSRRQARRYR